MAQLAPISSSYHDTIETYAKHIVKLLGIILIPQLITVVLGLAVQASFFSSLDGTTTLLDALSFTNLRLDLAIVLVILIGVIQLLGVIALTYCVVHHEATSVAASFEHALAYLGRFIGTGVVVTLTALVGSFVGFLVVTFIGILFSRFSLDIFNSIYNWLLLIPALLSAGASMLFVFAPYAIIEENASLLTALGKSYALVRAHFWQIALRIVLLYTVIIILVAILQIVPYVGNILALTVLLPFYTLYLFSVYTDLKAQS